MLVYVWSVSDPEKKIKVPGKPCRCRRGRTDHFNSSIIMITFTPFCFFILNDLYCMWCNTTLQADKQEPSLWQCLLHRFAFCITPSVLIHTGNVQLKQRFYVWPHVAVNARPGAAKRSYLPHSWTAKEQFFIQKFDKTSSLVPVKRHQTGSSERQRS